MPSPALSGLDEPLCAAHDLAMLDLDGVVYIGGDPVAGAADHLAAAREAGMRIAFITNNAARPPQDVAEHLRELGVPARPADVVTSAQAAAGVLRERFGTGARVACLGGPGLEWAVADAGLEVVEPGAEAVAIVTGYGPDLPWHRIMRAAVEIRGGLPWVASNTDATIPTRYGTAPGHGALVDLIVRFAGVEPVVAGKPARPLLDETVHRVGGTRPLMVGDRLDTDIEGGHNAGVPTLLVLTGVTGLEELVRARPAERPTYLARDLAGLTAAHPRPQRDDGRWRVGGWEARVEDGVLRVSGDGGGDDWWRAAAAAAWAHADEAGAPPGIAGLGIPEVARLAR
jgi:HAD superfamily hydrolase (TIGR01450 family)